VNSSNEVSVVSTLLFRCFFLCFVFTSNYAAGRY
jgi:hypothetical protein